MNSERVSDNAASVRVRFDRLTTLPARLRPHLLPVLLLTVAIVAVFGQILGHDFIRSWDDNRYVLDNADIQGFDPERLRTVFTSYYVGNYAPVQMVSYMLDYKLWGLHAGGFLLTNLLLHLGNALLVYRLLLSLVGGRLAAWAGAMLFALHPVQVETVAWISQRKNLLALFFFLLAWLFYLAMDAEHRKRRLYYGASIVALLFALLAKSVAVFFPFAMLLFDHCYRRAPLKSRLLDKIPYLLVSLVAVVMALLSQTPDYGEWGAGGGRAPYHGGSPWATFLTMLPVYCRYLQLIFWPTGLSAVYNPPVHTHPDAGVLAAAALLAVCAAGAFLLYRHDRRTAFWVFLALLALLPVSQIIPLVTLMNDRYLYFPMVGVAGVLACCLKLAVERVPALRPGLLGCLVILCGILLALSFRRAAVWRDGVALWSDAVTKSPNVALAWEGLGEAYHNSAAGRLAAAIPAYREAIRLCPGSDISRYNLGAVYFALNDYGNAQRVLHELLTISPRNVMGWALYGDLALKQFDYAEAERRYRKALSLQPEAAPVYKKLGNLLVVTGRLDEAKAVHLQIESLQGGFDPINAYDLAKIDALQGDTTGALFWLEQALSRGYSDFSGIMADEELTPVFADGRFAALVGRYFPRKP